MQVARCLWYDSTNSDLPCGVGQVSFQQNDAFRMTEIGHECHRDDDTVCNSSILVSEQSVVFNCVCDAYACDRAKAR